VVAEVRLGKLMAEGRVLFRKGCFTELVASLPDPGHFSAPLFPARNLATAAYVRRLATFYGAWDKLDYPSAASHSMFGPAPPGAGDWAKLAPTSETVAWVRTLATQEPLDSKRRIQHMRDLLVDLLACGERRLAQRDFSAVVQMGYAVLEKIVRVRLLLRDLEGISGLEDGLCSLERLRDPLARPLRDLRLRIFRRRNLLVTNHGTKTVGTGDQEMLADGYRFLERQVIADGGDEVQRSLWVARAPQRVVEKLPPDRREARVTFINRTACHGSTPRKIECFLN